MTLTKGSSSRGKVMITATEGANKSDTHMYTKLQVYVYHKVVGHTLHMHQCIHVQRHVNNLYTVPAGS